MWTPTTRQQHSRPVTRYQTDLTDAEWRVIAPHLPKPSATGRPREWPMREIVNGIFYVMRAGCPWRLLPKDLPPWGTIYRWFATWRDDGRFERINHALVMADRERVGRDASPSAAIIDCQSVKTTEAGGPRARQGAPPQPRVHRIPQASRCRLSGQHRDQADPRQSFRTHFEGNPSLARHPAARPLRLYLHAQARLLAQPDRGLFLQVRSRGPAPHPGDLKARTQGAHHGRHRRRQSPSRHPHLVLQACRGRLI